MKLQFFILGLLIPGLGIAQNPIIKIDYPATNNQKPPPFVSTNYVQPQGTDISTVTRIIVKFKSAPVPVLEHSQQRARVSTQQSEHEQFLSDLKSIEINSSAGRQQYPSKILQEYRYTFNGFALETTPEIAKRISSFSYVASVNEDKQVKAFDTQSNQIIGADKVWTDYNITGRGIRIGIVDTGIDYSHPDLGGGIGPSFKVIDGYDFVNEDADPMDDHGHGTHVAGIAAANGVIKGVAPDAKLIAYKVLNGDGYGFDSWILAAIERSVDPDQNPSTNDALHVVNMSLGGYADANEPYSEAIANATLQGVIFVIAAGNSWYYETIGSPGIAEQAITVGATDQFDNVAYFSSKGPTYDFRLKPDICAPGVGINSTHLQGGYQIFDGTSMASPHVAGAVALLLEKNPGWTPGMIKAALMQSSKKLSGNVWETGAGRMDTHKAMQEQILITPGSVSLGLLNSETSSWSKQVNISVYNSSTTSRNFSFHVEGGVAHPEISISILPASLTVAPGQTGTLAVVFDVNTEQLPNLDYLDGYFGKFVTTYDGKEIKNDIALLNPTRLTVNFTGELPNVLVAMAIDGRWKVYYPTTPKLDLLLPDINHHLYAQYYPNRYVIVEDQSNTGEIEINKSQAVNKIVFQPRDEHGNIINVAQKLGSGWGTFYGFNSVFFNPIDTVFISNTATGKLDFQFTDTLSTSPNTLYRITSTTGRSVSESKILSNNQEDFAEVEITAPANQSGTTYNMTSYYQFGIPGAIVFTNTNWITLPITNPIRLLMSKSDFGAMDESLFIKMVSLNNPLEVWETGAMKAVNSNNLMFYDRLLSTSQTILNAFPFRQRLGNSLLSWGGLIINFQSSLFIDPYPNGFYSHTLGDRKLGTVSYTVLSSGSPAQGVFQNALFGYGTAQLIPINPDAHTLILEYDGYSVAGVSGRAKTTTNLQPTYYYYSPLLTKLSLEENSVSKNSIEVNKQAVLKYQVTDGYRLNNIVYANLSIKKSIDNQWEQVSTIQEENDYTYLIQNYAEGYYDLKIDILDVLGTSLSYELIPAFAVVSENFPGAEPVQLIAPAHMSGNIFLRPQFVWNTVVSAGSYTIQVSKQPGFLSGFLEQNVTSSMYTFAQDLEYLTPYYWRVRANYATGSGVWSSINMFTTKELAVELIEPANQATQLTIPVQFSWMPIPTSINYTLQISPSDDFSFLVNNLLGSEETRIVQNLNHSTTYNWRVLAHFPNNVTISSVVRRFTTEIVTDLDEHEVILSHPYSVPNPFTNEIRIYFFISSPGAVSVSLVDIYGRSIMDFAEVYHEAGEKSVYWSTSDLSSGLYIARLRTKSSEERVKMILRR